MFAAQILTLALLVVAPGVARGADAVPPASATNADLVLGNGSSWRCEFVRRKPVVRVGQEIKEVWMFGYGGVWVVPDSSKKNDSLTPTIDSPAPPADWMAPDFDDRAWSRLPGPFFPTLHVHAYCPQVEDAGYLNFEEISPELAAICVRGRFMVSDPATAGDLKLSVAFRGGVVAYLNGQEIGRANIPESEESRGLEAIAEDYPQEVFVKPDGKPISWGFGDPGKFHPALQKRIRRLADVTVPARLLRKGVNVLAVEAHRAPYHESLSGVSESGRGKGYNINWCTVGITRIELTGGGAGVAPNAARPAGLEAWNQPSELRPKATDCGDPCEPLRPVRLVAARNGTFSGQVVVGSPAPLIGLKATCGEWKGPGAIPGSAVQVRYALPDKDTDLAFEILSTDPPAEVAVAKNAGAVMAVWVTVKVPADARPGDYKGALTISAAGAKPVEAGVELHVVDWTLPDPKRFVSHVGLTQSPDSVAMRYRVAMWSAEHWKLLDQVFALMGQAGADDIFIPAIRRTHHGNEHSMIRWIRNRRTDDRGRKTEGEGRRIEGRNQTTEDGRHGTEADPGPGTLNPEPGTLNRTPTTSAWSRSTWTWPSSTSARSRWCVSIAGSRSRVPATWAVRRRRTRACPSRCLIPPRARRRRPRAPSGARLTSARSGNRFSRACGRSSRSVAWRTP